MGLVDKEALISRRSLIVSAAGVVGSEVLGPNSVDASPVIEKNRFSSPLDVFRSIDEGPEEFPIPKGIHNVRFDSDSEKIYAIANDVLFITGLNKATRQYGDYSSIAVHGIEKPSGLVVKDDTILLTGVEGYDGSDPAVTAPMRHPVIGLSNDQGKTFKVLRIDAEGAEQGVDFGEFIKADHIPGSDTFLFLFSNNRKVYSDGSREYDWRVFDPGTGMYKIVSYGPAIPDHIFPKEDGKFRVVGRNFDEEGVPTDIVDIVIDPDNPEVHDFRDGNAATSFTNLNALACDPDGDKYGIEYIFNGNTVKNNFYKKIGEEVEQFDYGFLKEIFAERLGNKTIQGYPIVLTQIRIVNRFVVVAGLSGSADGSHLIIASWPKDLANPALHEDQVRISGGSAVAPMDGPMIPSNIQGIVLPKSQSATIANLGTHDAVAVTVEGCGSVVVPMDEGGMSEKYISFPNLGIAA